MEGTLKKSVILLVILFLGFWLVQDPSGFAASAKQTGETLWELLVEIFRGIISFFTSMTS